MTTSLFEPAARLTDDLESDVIPTWRLGGEPIYLEVVRDLGVPGRLEGPTPGAVLAGVLVESPPTVALTIVATQPLDLPRECDDCDATGDQPCRTPSGKRRLSDHTSRIRRARTAATA